MPIAFIGYWMKPEQFSSEGDPCVWSSNGSFLNLIDCNPEGHEAFVFWSDTEPITSSSCWRGIKNWSQARYEFWGEPSLSQRFWLVDGFSSWFYGSKHAPFALKSCRCPCVSCTERRIRNADENFQSCAMKKWITFSVFIQSRQWQLPVHCFILHVVLSLSEIHSIYANGSGVSWSVFFWRWDVPEYHRLIIISLSARPESTVGMAPGEHFCISRNFIDAVDRLSDDSTIEYEFDNYNLQIKDSPLPRLNWRIFVPI